MQYVVILLNLILTYLVMSATMPGANGVIAGGVITGFTIMIYLMGEMANVDSIIKSQIKSCNSYVIRDDQGGKRILLSIALLSAFSKLAIVIGVLLNFTLIAGIAVALFLVTGWFLSPSIEKISTVWNGAKVFVKIYSVINSIWDKLLKIIMKLEFKLLGIELKGQ